ncbi:restriction endonuclease subunit S [Ligilactobacillus salivarius]|uniref:restriction endonuclease subunit S n=1 Tax=Ligilactobacillus salivarius TaxID=1624 RepID=UPI0024BBCBE1|nr:restriction endonuclease subunit S [Ligilactobacillus salivarius]
MIVKNSSLSVDTEKLRKKILDLAMRGKLVPQDSQDEPASVLLEKIKEEKAQLIKEKKIKKSKPLPEITEEEKLFEIPESWEWVRLGENIQIDRGGSPRPIKSYLTDDENGINWIKIGDTKENSKYITSTKEKIIPEGLKKTRLVNKGDFLLSNSMSFGRPYILKIDGAIHDGWLVISDFVSMLDNDFLYYLLSSKVIKDQFARLATGSTVKNLNKDRVSRVIIPLPPLAEQKRIVAKVEECMQAIKIIEDSSKEYEKLENQLDKKVLDLAMRGKLVPQDSQDELASVLLEKIKEEKAQLIKEKKIKKSKPLPEITEEEKPFEIPESWEWVRLGEVSAINTGNTPSKKYKEYYGGDLPFVKPADINNNHINYDTDEKLTDKGKEKGRIASPNDILITCIGNLGRNYFLDKDVAFNQQINAVTPINIEKIWLHYTLLSSFFIQQMYNNASATTVSILNKTKLERLLVPLPPLAEQKRIVTKIKEIEIYLKN